MIYGECKWWMDPVGENILDQLIERTSLTEYGRDNPSVSSFCIPEPGLRLHFGNVQLRSQESLYTRLKACCEAQGSACVNRCTRPRRVHRAPTSQRGQSGLKETWLRRWIRSGAPCRGTRIISISDPRASVRARKSMRLTPLHQRARPGHRGRYDV
jgi:hypothetical protein